MDDFTVQQMKNLKQNLLIWQIVSYNFSFLRGKLCGK